MKNITNNFRSLLENSRRDLALFTYAGNVFHKLATCSGNVFHNLATLLENQLCMLLFKLITECNFFPGHLLDVLVVYR